jgi:hypothetical protein
VTTGGQAATRGFVVQALVLILDALAASDWLAVEIEPNVASEKVDFRWTKTDKTTVAVQVKSSQSTIGLAACRQWARELTSSGAAGHYELRLVGPASAEVCGIGTVEGVSVPTPRGLDLFGLSQQAAHALDGVLTNDGISGVPPFVRELLIGALTDRMLTFSTQGSGLSRTQLSQILKD